MISRAFMPASARPKGLRPEIQALRAIAVLLVVFWHIWPTRLTGGYVGVDVFFVISGFLITTHLLAQLESTGTIRLSEFWSRRIRRLLPAALVVLAFCLAATIIWLPLPLWQDNLIQIAASALYVENWLLASQATDYFALESSPTLVQHYWSLAVEEQFYLFWPMLILGGYWGVRALTRRVPNLKPAALLGMVGIVVVIAGASFTISVAMSSIDPSAYFVLQTRVWEFAVGGILAFLPLQKLILGAGGWLVLRALVSWIGFIAIFASALLFNSNTTFPGMAALLPVLGTSLVIATGQLTERYAPTSWLDNRPVQYLGDISYSMYLWHWPLVVVAGVITARPGNLGALGVIVLIMTIIIAAATKRFVEDRFRKPSKRGLWSRQRSSYILAAGGASAFLVACVVIATTVLAPANQAFAASLQEAEKRGCLGAAALHPTNACPEPFAATNTVSPVVASTDRIAPCEQPTVSAAYPAASCVRGQASAELAIALIGDSHAQVMADAVDNFAIAASRKLVEYTLGSCPGLTTDDHRKTPNENPSRIGDDPERLAECAEWTRDVIDEVLQNPSIESVIFTNATLQYLDPADEDRSILQATEVAGIWKKLSDGGKKVILIRDVPGLPFGELGPTCVQANMSDPRKCSIDRASIDESDLLTAVARASDVPVVDLSDYFCDEGRCYAVIGGLVAYWDRAHMTGAFMDSLEPFLLERLESSLAHVDPP